MLQIKNLRNQIDHLHHAMYHTSISKTPDIENASLGIKEKVVELKNTIENLCSRHHGTPADMGTPSFRQYLWLRYLSCSDALPLHLAALMDFDHIIKTQKTEVASTLNHFMIKIDYSGYLYQRKVSRGKSFLLINEGFIKADRRIREYLITAAFARRKNRSGAEVKSYSSSKEFIHMSEKIAGSPIANSLTSKGKQYDLAGLFHELNLQYFKNSLRQPRLVWSSSRARRRLGYYHPEIHTIAVNKMLDNASVPRLPVAYILYHEMLHQFFGIEHRNGRRYAHTAAFHQAEKQFENYQEAENLIKLLY